MSDLTLLINEFNDGPGRNVEFVESQSIDNILRDDGLESSESAPHDAGVLKSSAVEAGVARRASRRQRESDLFNFSDIGGDSDVSATQVSAEEVPKTVNFSFNKLKNTKPVKIDDIFADGELTRQQPLGEPTIAVPLTIIEDEQEKPEEKAPGVEDVTQGIEPVRKSKKRERKAEISDSEDKVQETKKRHQKSRKRDAESSSDESVQSIEQNDEYMNTHEAAPVDEHLDESSFQEYVQLVDAKREQRDVNIVTAGNVKREIASKDEQILTAKQEKTSKRVNVDNVKNHEPPPEKQENDMLESSVEIEQIAKPILRQKGKESLEVENVNPVIVEQTSATEESRERVSEPVNEVSEEINANLQLSIPSNTPEDVKSHNEDVAQAKLNTKAGERNLSIKSIETASEEQPKSSLSVPEPQGSNEPDIETQNELSMNDLDNYANSLQSDTIRVEKPTRKPSRSLSISNEPVNKPAFVESRSKEFLESESSGNAVSATFSAQDTAMSESILQEYDKLYDSAPKRQMFATEVVEESFLEQRNPLNFYFQKHNLTHLLCGNELADYQSKHVEFFELSLDGVDLPQGHRGVLEPPVRRILGERIMRENGRITGLRVLVQQLKQHETMTRIGRLAARKTINPPEVLRAAEEAGVRISELKQLDFGAKPHIAGVFAAGGVDLKMGVLRAGEQLPERRSRGKLVFLVAEGQIRINGVSVRMWECSYVEQGTTFSVVGEADESIFWIFE